jgi:triosephosphate isomerase (TIM)
MFHPGSISSCNIKNSGVDKMTKRTPLIAGNWKMNLDTEQSTVLVKAITEGIKGISGVDVLVAPPFTNLYAVRQAIGEAPILLAAQNMHWEKEGAFTGEVSPQMLIDAGCSHVILGHSERRSLFKETDEMINSKVKAAFTVGLTPIVCIGETLAERENDKTFEVIRNQLKGSLKIFIDDGRMPISAILAYEPVWAIGTGRTATPEQAQEVHLFIRKWIKETFDQDTSDRIRILYGGSVKPDNARALMSCPDIDGALVGGASIKADSFLGIIRF